ncbi:MAG TPA: MFS transporter, partial [Deinococcales bacterium]|nr:MFS transporter [Deinococcales bacterium]
MVRLPPAARERPGNTLTKSTAISLPREPAAAAELGERDVRRTMRLSLVEGAFAMFFINWTAGSVLTGYALHLGATPTELGLIGSVPLLAQAASPLVAWAAARQGRRKPLAVACAMIGRALWFLAALLPAIAPAPARMPLLIATIALSAIFQSGNGTLWTAWMGDLVPARERGLYFGLRTGLLGVVGTAASLLAGAFLDAVASPLDFQVVLVVAVICGIAAAAILAAHAEPPSRAPRLHFRESFTTPFADPNFRRYLLFASYWTFAVLVASPFVLPYFLSHLKMTFTQVAIWSTISSVFALVLAPRWGWVADRVGNRPVLQIATFGAGTLLPLSWMLASPGVLWPIWVSAAIDAAVWGAIGPANFNLALSSAPQANRVAFIGVLSAVTGITG